MQSINTRQPNNTSHSQPHVDSWYAASADQNLVFPPLQGEATADVCIIGGGYTGTTAAIRLKQAGVQVTLIDKEKLGTTASARNGGPW